MSKKIDLELTFPVHQAELFRVFVHKLNYRDEEDPTKYTGLSGVGIIYEEDGKTSLGNPCVEFSLWFEKPATAYWFALYLEEAKTAWQQLAADEAARAAYPKFLFLKHMGTWLRYNSPEYFCLVSESQLQVRRERPQELYKPEQVQVITEAAFLEAYQRVSEELRVCAKQLGTYQRRGAPGNEWFYCNPLYASSQLPHHVRLNYSQDEHGYCWQLLWAHDTRRNDARRVASTQQEFEQQLTTMLAEVKAAATGQQKTTQP